MLVLGWIVQGAKSKKQIEELKQAEGKKPRKPYPAEDGDSEFTVL